MTDVARLKSYKEHPSILMDKPDETGAAYSFSVSLKRLYPRYVLNINANKLFEGTQYAKQEYCGTGSHATTVQRVIFVEDGPEEEKIKRLKSVLRKPAPTHCTGAPSSWMDNFTVSSDYKEPYSMPTGTHYGPSDTSQQAIDHQARRY